MQHRITVLHLTSHQITSRSSKNILTKKRKNAKHQNDTYFIEIILKFIKTFSQSKQYIYALQYIFIVDNVVQLMEARNKKLPSPFCNTYLRIIYLDII